MQQKRTFSDRLVRGILAMVPTTKPSRNQLLLHTKSKQLVKVLNVKNKTITVETLDENPRKAIVSLNQLQKCVMHVMEPKLCTCTVAYDVNMTKLNIQRILSNIGKQQFGFLNCIDLLPHATRFDENGNERMECRSRGYRFFIRLVSEEKAARCHFEEGTFMMMQRVNRIFREPYPYEQVDSFVSLNDDTLQISNGPLRGTYIRQK